MITWLYLLLGLALILLLLLLTSGVEKMERRR